MERQEMEGKQRRKALLVTHVSGFVPQFEMNNVHILQKMGYEVHYASNFHTPSYGTDNHRLDGTGIICHQIDFVRSPFDKRNFQVYRQMVELMRRENFSLVHCHTPMGPRIARPSPSPARRAPARRSACWSARWAFPACPAHPPAQAPPSCRTR